MAAAAGSGEGYVWCLRHRYGLPANNPPGWPGEPVKPKLDAIINILKYHGFMPLEDVCSKLRIRRSRFSKYLDLLKAEDHVEEARFTTASRFKALSGKRFIYVPGDPRSSHTSPNGYSDCSHQIFPHNSKSYTSCSGAAKPCSPTASATS